MTDKNAYDEVYELIELSDKPALFTYSRIDQTTLPQGLYAFDIFQRDDDERAEKAADIISVRYVGTIISKEKGIDLDEGEFSFEGVRLTLEEFERGEYENELEYE